MDKKTASEILRAYLEKIHFTLHICDDATGGLLESTIKTPKTYSHLDFVNHQNEQNRVIIKGLDEFWHAKDAIQTKLIIDFNVDNKQKTLESMIPFRGNRVKQYAVEFICWKLYEFLNKAA